MSFEVTKIDPDGNAFFLTLKITVRILNIWAGNVSGGVGNAEIFYADKATRKFIGNCGFTFGGMAVRQTTVTDLRFPLEPEAVYLIEEARGLEGDVSLDLFFSGIYLGQTADGLSEFRSSQASYRISMSDWVRISQPWGKDAALVVISPSSKKKLDELRKTYLYSNLDDVIDEAYEQLKAKKARRGEESSQK